MTDDTKPAASADAPKPVAWGVPSLLVTMSAVEKNDLTAPHKRARGGGWESAARSADKYNVPLYSQGQLDVALAAATEREEGLRRALQKLIGMLEIAAVMPDAIYKHMRVNWDDPALVEARAALAAKGAGE